jgi:hypothetical protein
MVALRKFTWPKGLLKRELYHPQLLLLATWHKYFVGDEHVSAIQASVENERQSGQTGSLHRQELSAAQTPGPRFQVRCAP